MSADRIVDGFPKLDERLPERVEVGVTVQGLLLETLLGTGSMGQVFATQASDSDPAYALKVIPKNRLQTMEMVEIVWSEFCATTSLAHSGIAQLHALLHGPDHLFMVQELAGCCNLSAAIRAQEHRHFRPEAAWRIFIQVAGALAHCHDNGVAHCDLKPENLTCSSCGNEGSEIVVKLIDFGLAQQLEDECQHGGGSMPFVAPEVLLSPRWKPGPTDIWSLGMVLLEIAGGVNFLRQVCGRQQPWKPCREDVEVIARLVTDVTTFRLSYEQFVGELMSDTFWELVSGMMVLEPGSRLAARAVCEVNGVDLRHDDRLVGS